MPTSARVLHVSADFPDPIEPGKTTAVRSLVELTQHACSHDVISLNRRKPVWLHLAGQLAWGNAGEALSVERQAMAQGEAWVYHAPGRGVLHHTMLRALGSEIAARVEADGKRPDLLVGHKLTVEGIAVARAAEVLGKPYGLTIQGDTDTKILAVRPDLTAKLRAVFHGAAMVVSFSPWALSQVEARLGRREGFTAVIPCATELDTVLEPRVTGGGMVSVFHLKNYRRKNLAAMARALELLGTGGEIEGHLAIVGGGSPDDMAAAREAGGTSGSVSFEGPLDRSLVADRLNRASCLVLPSRRESFGMVFVEALFAGCPVIYPRNRAVAGFFDGLPFAIPVDPDSPADIAQAMGHAIAEESRLKTDLAAWQRLGGLQPFTRHAIAGEYGRSLAAALGGQQ